MNLTMKLYFSQALNLQVTAAACTCDRLRRHSLHAQPVFYKVDVMEVHWDLSLPAGVVAERKGRVSEDVKKHKKTT